MRGRLLLAGHPTRGLSVRDIIDVAYVLLTDGVNGLVDAQEVRKKVDDVLRTALPDRELWGNDADELDALGSASSR